MYMSLMEFSFPFWVLVFDVDIGDGEPIRKLPYNRTGDHSFQILKVLDHTRL